MVYECYHMILTIELVWNNMLCKVVMISVRHGGELNDTTK